MQNKNTKKLVPNKAQNYSTYTRINEPRVSYLGSFIKVTYDISNKLLTKQLLSGHINAFWDRFISRSEEDIFYALYIVIQYKGGVYKSLGRISKLKSSDLNKFLKVMQSQLDFKDNQYFNNEVVAIHFNYKPIDQNMLANEETIIHEPLDKYIATSSKIFGYDLPNNMNLFTWGNVVKHNGSNILIEFTKNGEDFIYQVEMGENSNTILIKENYYSDEILLEFNDSAENGSTTNFCALLRR